MSKMGDLALALYMERRMLGRDLTEREIAEFTKKYINKRAKPTTTKER